MYVAAYGILDQLHNHCGDDDDDGDGDNISDRLNVLMCC
jgi:hypothetical protein